MSGHVQLEEFFKEIFVETSSGDVGIQVKGGPQFRVHSTVLSKIPGFMERIRQCPSVPLYISGETMSCKKYFKSKGYKRLADEIEFTQFTTDKMTEMYEIPALGGYTTASKMSGTSCC